jgi:hypothetical protein
MEHARPRKASMPDATAIKSGALEIEHGRRTWSITSMPLPSEHSLWKPEDFGNSPL